MPLGTVARACWGDDGGETCAATRLESVTNSCRASISWAPRTRSRSRPAGHSGSPSRRVDRRRGQRHRPGYLQCLIGARDSQLIHQYADVVLVAVPGGVDLHRQHVFRRCACHDQAGRVEDGACPIVLGRRHKPPGLLVEPVWVQTCSAAITSAAASTSSFAYSVMSGKAPRGARETLWRRGALGRGLELPSQVPRRSSGSNQLDHLLAERRRVRRSGFRHRGYLLLQQDWVSTEPGQLQLGLLRYESVSHRFRGSSSAGGNVPVLGSTFAPTVFPIAAVDDFEPGNRIIRGEITGGHPGAVRTSNTEGTGERHRRRGASASRTRRAGSALLLIDRSTAWQPADRATRGGVDVHAAQARPSRIAGMS